MGEERGSSTVVVSLRFISVDDIERVMEVGMAVLCRFKAFSCYSQISVFIEGIKD